MKMWIKGEQFVSDNRSSLKKNILKIIICDCCRYGLKINYYEHKYNVLYTIRWFAGKIALQEITQIESFYREIC